MDDELIVAWGAASVKDGGGGGGYMDHINIETALNRYTHFVTKWTYATENHVFSSLFHKESYRTKKSEPLDFPVLL